MTTTLTMSRRLARVIARRAERAAAQRPQLIRILGGWPGKETLDCATVGSAKLIRGSDETMREFERRALDVAQATGVAFAVTGGLPD